ncbi:MAG: NADH-ubiquinone oxidoreductase-F iron-sulfur binding region domain-containing protein [Chromatiales bacterium]|jgi:[NiFe] hydrogenase diaphorase moiety large subunit
MQASDSSLERLISTTRHYASPFGVRHESSNLLQYLQAIQARDAFISTDNIAALGQTLGLSTTQIKSVIDFYSLLNTEPCRYDIRFSDNITDRMQHNGALRVKLQAAIKPVAEQVRINTTSCTGLCDQGPGLLVNGVAIGTLDADRISQIAELINSGVAVSDWPIEFFQIRDNIHRKDLLLEALDQHDNDGLQALLKQDDNAILETLQQSGLRGRGGAGFPTARKWQSCRDSQARQRYVVCNADEGEPGTFKDRVLLNRYAHQVFEGMTLCAAIIGATRGFIYLRSEYRYLLGPLLQVRQQRLDAGLLGDNILNQPGLDFDIGIHIGAGAYICGEESALIESLEGKRGVPRIRPPFPVVQGYDNQPTVVNNVETFAAAAAIAARGADWFRQAGTDESTGSKLLSISGDCAKPGIYEYPFGVRIREILDDCGAHDSQAVQIAGAAGRLIPADQFERKLAFEDLATGGSFMVFDQSRNLLDVVDNFAGFFVHESCGFCTPCRVGTSLLRDLFNKLQQGHASAYDVEEMRRIGHLMRHASHCGLGTTAANPLLDLIENFPQLVKAQLGNPDYEPAFDLDAALQQSRNLTGRNDDHAHL